MRRLSRRAPVGVRAAPAPSPGSCCRCSSRRSPRGPKPPPLPSSCFGSAAIQGAPAPDATAVSAWLGATELATARTFSRAGVSFYRLDIPGDRADTSEVEGAVEGDAIELRLGGAPAGAVLWHAGTYSPFDLAAGAGADLRLSAERRRRRRHRRRERRLHGRGGERRTGTRFRCRPPRRCSRPRRRCWRRATAATSPRAASSGRSSISASSTRRPSPSPWGSRARRRRASRPSRRRRRSLTTAAAGADPDPGDDQASDVDTLLAAPDLSVAISDGATSVPPGSTLFARVTAANPGSQDATGVVVALDLPAGVEFYSASHGGSVAAGRITWPAVPLAATAALERTATLRLPATLDPGLTQLLFTASAADDGANGADLDPADNSASDLDEVTHGPDLVVAAVDATGVATDPDLLEVSGEAVVAIANRGTLAAGAFGLVLFSDVDGDGSYDAGTDVRLGATTVAGLAAGAQASESVAVAGAVRFRGDRLFAMVDPELAWPELDETNNVGDSSRACGVTPSAGPFTPRLELSWPPAGAPVFRPGSIDSLSTPLVVQLTDDNGDGLWDERDVPDLVFVTTNFYELMEPQIYLRAIRGDTGAALFDVDGFLPHPTAPTAFSFSGLAAGDIDGDGRPELVTTTFGPYRQQHAGRARARRRAQVAERRLPHPPEPDRALQPRQPDDRRPRRRRAGRDHRRRQRLRPLRAPALAGRGRPGLPVLRQRRRPRRGHLGGGGRRPRRPPGGRHRQHALPVRRRDRLAGCRSATATRRSPISTPTRRPRSWSSRGEPSGCTTPTARCSGDRSSCPVPTRRRGARRPWPTSTATARPRSASPAPTPTW